MAIAARITALLAAVSLTLACQKDDKKADNKADQAKTSESDQSKVGASTAAETPAPATIPAPPDVAAPPADAQKTEKGVFYKVLQPAPQPGDKPKATDKVKVHYTGWTTDGKMFDSSVPKNSPATFGLNQVIPGWTDGLQVMTVGEKTRFWIPDELAYKGRPGAPQGMLVFDVELLDILKAPEVPEDVAKPPQDAQKTKLGVFYKVLKPGTGQDRPRPHDKVQVHYSGWTTDGKMFDSSVMRGNPAGFVLTQVIPGWSDGLQTMVAGQKNRFWIPEELAYKGARGKPAGMLVFDVELLEVQKMPDPPAVPEDVAAPPKDAKKTSKGVFYKVLNKGTGTAKPTATSKVKVHYSGWTTDGKMFDSSVSRNRPASFSLTGVIPGWTDGLQVMVVGEKTRFWIPEELAYGGRSGKPAGMLVFDVELLEILD